MPHGTDSHLVKTAHKKTKYTRNQAEHLEKCLDPDSGPLHFMSNFVYIQHPVQGRLLFEPYDFQHDLIDNYHNYRFSINMCARQMGKTTVAAGYLLWYAMFKPDSTILIAAHKYQGAAEIMQRVRYAYESVPDFVRAGVVNYNRNSIDFDNGSRIMAATTTETTGRGMSLSLIYMDEFAFVQPRVAKEFWTALSPTLATGGKCIITSTPNSDDDQFATIWREANARHDEYGEEQSLGKNGFSAVKVVWDQHPERNEKWAKEERSRVGEERFRREHLCEFIIYDETLIDALKLVGLRGREPLMRTGEVRWFHKPKKGRLYLIGLDPSLGTGGDFAAIEVYDGISMEQVAEWQHNKSPVKRQIKIMQDILLYIAKETDYTETAHTETEIFWSVENNTLGEACLTVIEHTGEENFPGMMVNQPKTGSGQRRYRKGFTTTAKTKLSVCATLKNLVEANKMEVNSRRLVRELKNYVANGLKFEAKVGETDDLISATLLVLRISNHLAKYDDRIHDRMAQNAGDDDEFGFEEPLPMGII